MDASGSSPTAATRPAWQPFPQIDLRQLLRLSDDTGMLQHAVWSVPDPHHGYCIDDNARALIAGLLHAKLRGYDERVVPIQRYLSFLVYAFNDQTRTFRNFMGYDRRWLEETGSQDSQGRTIWALGLAVELAPNEAILGLAQNLLERALPAIETFDALRAKAFALLGLHAFLQHAPEHDHAQHLRDRTAENLFAILQAHADEDWPWWEDILTYDNAKLPHGLLVSGYAMHRNDMIDAALRSLRWLIDVQTAPDGHISIIGNDGWYPRGGKPAKFDQQPLEAHAMVHACLAAADFTADAQWAEDAWRCFAWFTGRNDLGVSLFEPGTGGCQDGLNPHGPNKNQGAESSLAYLLSVLELHHYREQQLRRVRVKRPTTIGLGIVGASDFARFCLESYRGMDGLRPVAIWNRTASKAQQFADDEGLTAHDTVQELAADPRVQLVLIATTPARHAEHALTALEAGKHVLCEKPLATTVVDAQSMLEAAAKRDRRLGVNFMMRYCPVAELAARVIASGAVGVPLRGNLTNRAGDAGLPDDHWFWNEEESGGIFIEHGVHFFDLVGAWLEQPAGKGQVLGAHRLRRPGSEIIDQVGCEVRYGEQTLVSFYHGFTQTPHTDQQDFRLVCEHGQLQTFGWVPARLEIEAALDEPEIEQLQVILPDAECQTLQRFGNGTTVRQRGRTRRVARLVRFVYEDPTDKQQLYTAALRELMNDLIEAIHNWHHTPRITADAGVEALKIAVEADRIARVVTP